MNRPVARSSDLIVDTIGDELLIYDTLDHRAHSLNAVASAVWRACDGTRTTTEIAEHTRLDPVAVELALDNLTEIGLLDGHASTGINRRAALRKMSLAAAGVAVVLPVIRSITAPTAAMAYGMHSKNVQHAGFVAGPCSADACSPGSVCDSVGPSHGCARSAEQSCSTGSTCQSKSGNDSLCPTSTHICP